LPIVLLGSAVKLVRIIAVLMVLAAWLPATAHCLLTGVHLLPGSCEQDHHHGDVPAKSHDDCGQCAMESGGYKLSDQDTYHLTFQPNLSWRLNELVLPTGTLCNMMVDPGRAPPDLARWQFTTRAALPGRAPALL